MGTDSFLAKFSAVNGAYKWAKRTGGALHVGHSVATDGQGNIVLTGCFDTWTQNFGSTTLTSAGGTDIFVAKYSSLGVLTWAEGFGGLANDDNYAVAVDSTGHCVTSGVFSGTANFGGPTLTSAGGNDVSLLRVDP
jgi:hypothetical protein